MNGPSVIQSDRPVGKYEELRHLTDTYMQVQKLRIANSNRSFASTEGVDDTVPEGFVVEIVEDLEALEKKIFRQMKRTVKHHPAWEWLDGVKGMGPTLSTKILGLISDIEKFETISKLWSFCLPPGSMVSTDSGTKPIETLSLADKVYGRDGKLHPVSNLTSRGYSGSLRRINVAKALSIESTPEHRVLVADVERYNFRQDSGKWTIRRRLVTGSERWKQAGDVEPGDFLVIPKLSETDSTPPDVEIAYFMGRYVGDGSTSLSMLGGYERGRVNITFARDEADALERAENTAQRYGGVSVVEGESVYQLHFGRTRLARDFRKRFGGYAEDKRIPDDLMNMPVSHLQAFVKGYFDADGCRVQGGKENCHVANTASMGLALQLQQMLTKLGVLARVSHTRRAGMVTIQGKPAMQGDRWNITISDSQTLRAFGVEAKGNRFAGQHVEADDAFLVPVRSVEDVPYEGKVYDITAEGSFLVNNLTVHNSGYGLYDGKKQTPVKGQKLTYNRRLKTAVYLAGDSFIKSRSPYRDLYDEAKVYYRRVKQATPMSEILGLDEFLDRETPDGKKQWDKLIKAANKEAGAKNDEAVWSDGHVDNAARRKMVKVFLSHLWLVWREAEGLPVSGPYITEHDPKHTHTIGPWSFSG